jgi:hypothetical protein
MRARRLLPILVVLAASPALTSCVGGLDVLTGPGPNCKEVEVDAVLHVDASDPRQIWGIDLETGRDITVSPGPDLAWRVDSGAPQRLIDHAGQVVGLDGDTFQQACFDALTNTYFIGPEDLSDSESQPD